MWQLINYHFFCNDQKVHVLTGAMRLTLMTSQIAAVKREHLSVLRDSLTLYNNFYQQ